MTREPQHPEVNGHQFFVDITAGEEIVPSFPVELLPRPYSDYVADVADRQQLPPDVVAIPVMVAAATMLGSQVHIAAKRHDTLWRERCCLWGGVLGPSGIGKTDPMREALRPLSKLNSELRERSKQEQEEWLTRPKNTRGPKPGRWAVVVGDTTIEGLLPVMEANPRGLLLYRDELTAWLSSFNLYRGGSGPDRQFYLECYSGGQYNKTRADDQRDVFIEDLYLNIVGGIQPSVFRHKFADGPQDGLLPRFGLLCYPVYGGRPFADVRPDFTAINAYSEALLNLREVRPREPSRELGGHLYDSADVRLSGEAYSVWSRWMDRHGARPEMRDEDSAFGLHIAKYPGLYKRLMLLVHFMRHGPKAEWEVSEETAHDVGLLIDDYLEPHARRVYAIIDSHPSKAVAVKIANWLRKSERQVVKFTARDLRKNNWPELRKDDDRKVIAGALEYLEAMGWVELEQRRGGSGPRTVEAFVMPKVYGQ